VRKQPPLRPPHPRIVATLALLPVIVGLEIPLCMFCDWLDRYFDELVAWPPAVLFPAVALYLGCFLIWKRTITWTPGRRIGVLVIVAASALLVALTTGVAALIDPSDDVILFTLLSASLIVSSVALCVTARVCYDPPEPARVPCPTCGYDLRGQRECRCPECGQEYALGNLAADSRD
jgi:hypothetical protein